MRNKFNHNFIEPKYNDLKTEEIDGKRYYIVPNGDRYLSVTSLLSNTNKEFLETWKKRVGEEEANRISEEARIKGDGVHQLCENYLLNNLKLDNYNATDIVGAFISVKGIIDGNINNVMGIELPLYSNRMKLAGRTDCIAEWKNKPAIIDFKTSRRTKKEDWIQNYFLQATCYSIMIEELFDIKIEDLVIIIAVKNEPPQIFEKKRKDYYKPLADIYNKYYIENKLGRG